MKLRGNARECGMKGGQADLPQETWCWHELTAPWAVLILNCTGRICSGFPL